MTAGSYRTGDALPVLPRYASEAGWISDRPGTIEEKLDAAERTAKELGEPFNRRKERAILNGKPRTPYLALNGEAFRTKKAKDARNRALLKELGQYARGESDVNPFPWFTSAAPVYAATPPFPSSDLSRPRNYQSFEDMWQESYKELESAHWVGPNDYFTKVAILYYWVDRPSLFSRIIKAVKEAIRA